MSSSSSTRVYPSHALNRSFTGRDFFPSDPLPGLTPEAKSITLRGVALGGTTE